MWSSFSRSRDEAAITIDFRKLTSSQYAWLRLRKSALVCARLSIRLRFCAETLDCVRTKFTTFVLPSGCGRILLVDLENARIMLERKCWKDESLTRTNYRTQSIKRAAIAAEYFPEIALVVKTLLWTMAALFQEITLEGQLEPWESCNQNILFSLRFCSVDMATSRSR